MLRPVQVMRGARPTPFDNDRRLAALATITGREPLPALDGWIREWRSRGGDMARKEREQGLKEQR